MIKTIKIQDTTHSELVKLGYKGETFDDIIMKLVNITKKIKSADKLVKER